MGILLAVIGTFLMQSALTYALWWYLSHKERPEASPTRKRREPEYVTHEELREAIAESTKDLTFEWNEWYEKFDKLHLRLSKREKRAKQDPEQDLEQLGFDAGERPSVLAFRRIGSV